MELNVLNSKALDRQIKILDTRIAELQAEVAELQKRRLACQILLGEPVEFAVAAPDTDTPPPRKSALRPRRPAVLAEDEADIPLPPSSDASEGPLENTLPS